MTTENVPGSDSLRPENGRDRDTGGPPPVPAYLQTMTVAQLIEALQAVDPTLYVALPERWNYLPGDAGRMTTECTRVIVTHQSHGDGWSKPDVIVRVVELS